MDPTVNHWADSLPALMGRLASIHVTTSMDHVLKLLEFLNLDPALGDAGEVILERQVYLALTMLHMSIDGFILPVKVSG